ncbi:MAG: aminodeoxychorismate synthase component I, partial [Mesorhizobium sp.]
MSLPSAIFRNDESARQLVFDNPAEIIVAHEAEDFLPALEAAQTAHGAGKWLAGYLSYEAGYLLEPKLVPLLPAGRRAPLVCLGVFDAPADQALPRSSAP